MLTLEQVSKNTDLLWTDEGFKMQEPSVQVRDHLTAYRELGMRVHEDEMHFTSKCDIAIRSGLVRLTEKEIVHMLTGETENKIKFFCDEYALVTTEGNQFYDPLFGKSFPICYNPRTYHTSLWSLRPKWKPIHMVPVSGLKCAVPYGVLLRLKELKGLNFFNCFFAFAPEDVVRTEMYQALPTHDPVVVATVSNRHAVRNVQNVHMVTFPKDIQFAHFFVAKW